MKPSPKELASQIFRMRGRKASVVMLMWANWLLLGVSWGMSLRIYARLPGRMALWSSLWRQTPAVVGKSLAFFFYPAVQTAVFLGGMAILGRFFLKSRDTRDLSSLKAEVSYLEMIFINLLFIHFQTSLILVSYGQGRGANVSYVMIILAVIVMLVPYYHVRRRLLAR
jgi:hypothetical protein